MTHFANRKIRLAAGMALPLAALVMGASTYEADATTALSAHSTQVHAHLALSGDPLVQQVTSPPLVWAPGSRVECNWKGRGRMYRGTIARRLGRNRIRVHYDDGDRESSPISRCRLLSYGGGGSQWYRGARVECDWKGRGNMYTGTIARVFSRNRIRVHYDDGDRETTSTAMCDLL